VRTISLVAALFLTPALAPAQSSAAAVAARPDADASPSLWRPAWPEFSWVEGVATVSAGLATGYFFLQAPPNEPRWRGGILFDDAVRDATRLDSASGRQRLRSVGDVPYYLAPLLPLIVDPLVVSWLVRDDPKLAYNLAFMGLEAFSYAGLTSFISTRLSVRERPDTTQCRLEHPDFEGCRADTEAFWSGHTSIVAASAGLVCGNHQYVPLWGSPAADASACALASGGALLTAGSRLLADRHYASDVLVGMGVGFAFGYAVPALLHYRRRAAEVIVAVQPDAQGDGASLNEAGVF
jgi:membrane-associated phospholipid phosphatase